jgi:outer membrane receptor protein involved in Fe transport
VWTSLGVALLAVLTTQAARAQDETDDSLALEEVIVTGTRIPRRDYASPSPVSTLDQLTIEFSGQPTLEEALNQMPQVQPDFGRTSNNPGDGTARINLRGLGAERTLVMLNGRRLSPSGAGSAVDVNTLPQALIERVEIITGGASTVYGSDAVAGVVNFLTVQDFEGVSLETSYYLTEEGDSDTWDINGAWGTNFAGERGNVTVFLAYLDREPTFGADRAVSSEVLFDVGTGLVPGGSTVIPEGSIFFPRIDFGNGPVRARFDESGNLVPFLDPEDRYNFQPLNYLQTQLERTTAGALVRFDVTERLELYGEATFTRNETQRVLAPTPITDFFATNLDNPFFTDQVRQIAAESFFPAGPNAGAFALLRRMSDLGPRIIDDERDYLRLVAGVRGDLGDTWNFDAWVIYTDGDENQRLSNGVLTSRFAQGLFVDPATGQCFDPSNGCVPLNVFTAQPLPAEALAFIVAQPFNNTTNREQKLASGYVSGSPFELWDGPLDVAFGLEWRSDSVDFLPDPAFENTGVSGYIPQTPISGEETVWEIYGEAVLPLLVDRPGARYLGLELGARYSDYDNAGSVDTWKAGLQWEMIDGVRFRTIFQRSVRAPNLAEAFTAPVTVTSSFTTESSDDPCSASADPVGRGNVEQCLFQGIPADQIGVYEATAGFPAVFTSGGNPNLVPEEGETFTAGFVFTLPSTPNLQVSVDYFDLEVEDTIGSIDVGFICFDANNTENLFCENIRRDPLTYNVVEVFEPISNRGLTRSEGIDTQLTWASDLPDWAAIRGNVADLRLNLIWTHTLSRINQANPVSSAIECAGYFGDVCRISGFGGETFPEDRVLTNLLYRSGPLDANLTWRWIGGSDNAAVLEAELLGARPPELAIPGIGSTNYFDLGVGYEITEHLRLVLNVVNLFDEAPPVIADQAAANNVDTTLYDIFGRSYQLALFLRY